MKKNLNEKQPETESERSTRVAKKKTTIGGQALIEGLMMIGPTKKAIAIRKSDGSILLEEIPMARFSGAANIPFIRGGVRIFQQMISGTKALLRSADFFAEADTAAEASTAAEADTAAEAEDKAEADTAAEAEDKAEEKKLPFGKRLDLLIEKHSNIFLYGSVVFGILVMVFLFFLLPNFITGFIAQLTGLDKQSGAGYTILKNLIEGLIRIIIFVAYLALASLMKDIKRVWMYHGAEHKTIACYEDHQPMTVDNARRYSRFHPRCGTAFLFIVIIVSIIVFSFVGWWGRWVNLLIRFALVPIVAGIAYEIIRLAGRYDNRLTKIISQPGLWLQRLTTAEPDDSMLEVAITALNAVVPEHPQSDRW